MCCFDSLKLSTFYHISKLRRFFSNVAILEGILNQVELMEGVFQVLSKLQPGFAPFSLILFEPPNFSKS